METLDLNFSKIIIFSNNVFDFDLRRQILNVYSNDDVVDIEINPFLYDKRKVLISKVLINEDTHNSDETNEVVKINEIINSQIKMFDLNPSFIIDFVEQYKKSKHYSESGINVFNMVYENSIKTRLIKSSDSENVNPQIISNILRELAYEMHFSKKSEFSETQLMDTIQKYKDEYRQNIDYSTFLRIAKKSNILLQNCSNVRFSNSTTKAYFVALAITEKSNQGEDMQANFDLLLKNLCFGINSDIVLFLALVNNNVKFIQCIINGATQHFEKMDELSFDKSNIGFLTNAEIQSKASLPTDKEKKNRDRQIAKSEEREQNESSIVNNEYDYTDEDLQREEIKLMISIKYIEILSKILAAFSQDMKTQQQDELISLIYQAPNKMLYSFLKPIDDNYEDFCNELFSSLKEANPDDRALTYNSFKNFVTQCTINYIYYIYAKVAQISANLQTIRILNIFKYNDNSNYQIQNLLMQSRDSDVSSFSNKAKRLKSLYQSKLHRYLIQKVVREYLFLYNFEIHGPVQSLINSFFKSDEAKDISTDMIRKKYKNHFKN